MWAEFTYDAYGLPQLHVPGAPDNTIAQAVQASIGLMLTPQLYRGYVYAAVGDMYTYYLGSRYYVPQLCRFFNADKHSDTQTGVLATNMFAYCNNNPVMNVDPTGESLSFISKLLNVIVKVITAIKKVFIKKVSYGAAKPYVYMPGSDDPASPNCYAYAIGSPVNEQPGGASGRIPTKWNDVNDVGKSVEADLKAKGYTVRKISGPDAKIYDNEFRIALRVGTQPYAYNQLTGQLYYDYHFMRQTDTGQWADKHGHGGASFLWGEGMTPETIPWTLNDVPYYDSEIIYYAVGN